MTEPIPEGRLLRLDRWPELVGWSLGGWFLLIGALSLLAAVAEGNIASLIIGLVLGWWGVAFLGVPGSGLIVHRHGIVIRDSLWGRRVRNREWTWSEVDRFELGRPLMKWALRIHLVDGSIESVPLLEKVGRDSSVAKDWIDELNRRAVAAAG